MNNNDVVLIYADNNKLDVGVVQDYSFDMCFGDSENSFECRVQKYNPVVVGAARIIEDFIFYIEFTEYGGIVDRIELDTKSGEVVFSGRTWHGMLNSYVLEPYYYTRGVNISYREPKYYSGEANAVISQIITDIGMTDWFTVENVDSGITISPTICEFKGAYDFIMDILADEDAKLIMWYQNDDNNTGKIHLEAVSRVNTGAFDEFDTSQTPFRIGQTYNKVNDLLCVAYGEDNHLRAAIHLYTDANGGLLPYCRTNPLQDEDYYYDISRLAASSDIEDIANLAIIQANMQTGDKKYTMVFDGSSSGVVNNYIKVDTKPWSWDALYDNYYYIKDKEENGENKIEPEEDSETQYTKFKKTYKDKYILTTFQPYDWNSNYKDYYLKETNSSDKMKKVEDLSESSGAVVKYRPNMTDDGIEGLPSVDLNAWTNYFEKESKEKKDLYYERVGSQGQTFKKVEAETEESYKKFNINGQPPFDWANNYKSYYLRRWNGIAWEYYSVPGIEKNKYYVQTRRPTNWEDNFGSYYFKATQKVVKDNEVIIKKGQYITVSDGINNDLIDDKWVEREVTGWQLDNSGGKEPIPVPVYHDTIHEFPKWRKNTFYSKVTTYKTPAYVQGDVYYKVTKAKAPTFTSGKYYMKYVDVVPQWRKQGKGANDFGGYYQKVKDVEVIPEFEAQDVYKKVADNYKELCEAGIKKLEKLADTDTLEVSLELESNYDVGDIVGGADDETGIFVAKPIRRKIVKIKKDIVSLNYEVD